MDHNQQRVTLPWIWSHASAYDGDDEEAHRFANALRTIASHLESQTGDKYSEISTVMNVWSVDVWSAVLVAGRQVFLVSYDIGA